MERRPEASTTQSASPSVPRRMATRALLIEDDGEINTLITRYLTAKDFTLQSAATGEEGVELLKAFTFDVCIIDKNLPRMSSREVLLELRAHAPATAVVMITANPTGERPDKSLIDGYLAKPFRGLAELLEAIERAREHRASTLQREQLQAQLLNVKKSLGGD
jgi:DNA-binding response OmpR family regulator